MFFWDCTVQSVFNSYENGTCFNFKFFTFSTAHMMPSSVYCYLFILILFMFYNSHVPCVLSLVFFFFWYFNIYSISFVYFVKFCIMCRIILNLASFVTSGITLRHETVNYMFWSIFSLIFFNNYSFIYALSQKLWENEQRNKEFLNS